MENKDTYPKELFIGDKVDYSCRIIRNEKEETQFREMGLVDYDDLPDPVETPEDTED